MPDIEFLIIPQSEPRARYLLACEKAASAYAQQQTVYIQCATELEARQLDGLLWSFDDISFIPHGQLDNQPAPVQIRSVQIRCVQIGFTAWPEQSFALLINLGPTIPPNPVQYSQIIEIVTQDPEIKNICRQHYKAYQAAGFTVKSHSL